MGQKGRQTGFAGEALLQQETRHQGVITKAIIKRESREVKRERENRVLMHMPFLTVSQESVCLPNKKLT